MTDGKRPNGLDRVDGAMMLALAGLALAIYGRTLAPGLLPGDSGEFQTLAALLGNTHPTGYPVFLLAAKPFTWLPIGEVAFRVNLFSAVMGSVAVAGVYLTGRLLTGYRGAATAGALALAVCPTFWSQAIIAEVYSSAAALIAFLLAALLWWDRSGDGRGLFVAGLLGGLGLGVHMSVALLAPAAALFLLTWRSPTGDARPRWELWRPAISGALVGTTLTVLGFVLLHGLGSSAGYFDAVVIPSHSAWESTPTSIDGPFEQLLFGWGARPFRSMMFDDPLAVMPRQAVAYWESLPGEVAPFFLGLAVVGVVALGWRWPRRGLLLSVALIVHWMCHFNYGVWDIQVFYIPGYLLLILLATAGWGSLIDGGSRLLRRWREAPLVLDVALLCIALPVGIWPAIAPQLDDVLAGEIPSRFRRYPLDDRSLTEIHPLVTGIVAELPENAILFTEWVLLYPLYYAAHLEQGRMDLTFIEARSGDVFADSVIPYVAARLPDHPVFFSEPIEELRKAGYAETSTRIGGRRFFRISAVE